MRPSDKLRIYRRDGFIDRYSPERWKLVHPGALRVLSLRFPDLIPTCLGPHNVPAAYRTNAPVWFDLWPAVDHIVPRCAGGSNGEQNLLCVSWWRNDSKGAMPLDGMGWEAQPPGDLADWDGLMSWFMTEVAIDPALLADPMVRNWHVAADK